MENPFICIAGKNNIAVDVLAYVIKHYEKDRVGIICNKTETGENTFQRSLRRYAQAEKIKEYQLAEIYDIKNLVFLSLEFDQIIKPDLFSDARLYNIHFSLLPKYKGMYTAAHCILKGEIFSGVTLHLIDSGIDTGDIIDQEKFEVGNSDCKQLYLKYVERGTQIVLKNISNIINNTVIANPQCASGSSYFSRKSIDYQNIVIDLNQTAEGISRQIRAFSFRDYQMPELFGKKIIDCKILKSRSGAKPGTILLENEVSKVISTVDYDVALYYDRLNELMEACASGDINMVAQICAVSKHINEQDKNGWTPLIKATYNNQLKIVYYLIAVGADVNIKNRNGTNLLMYAKDAFKNYGDNTLFKIFKKMGLTEKLKDYEGHDLIYYLRKDGIMLQKLTS